MHKIYKIIDWVKKFKLTPKEMIEGGYPQDRKDIIIFKNRELAQEWSKKHIEPNLSQKTIKNL